VLTRGVGSDLKVWGPIDEGVRIKAPPRVGAFGEDIPSPQRMGLGEVLPAHRNILF